MTVPCARCGAATDATLCEGCTRHTRVVLDAVPEQLRELEQATIRQSSMPASAIAEEGCTHAGDCGCGVAIPWSQWPSRAGDRLRNSVATWSRVLLAETYGEHLTCSHGTCQHTRPRCRVEVEIRRTMVDAAHSPAAYLSRHLESVRLREWAAAFAHELDRLTEDGWRAVDLPVDGLYAGPCGAPVAVDGVGVQVCTRRIWARPEEAAVRCKACGTTHVVADRQEHMLRAAEDLLMPAKDIASSLTLMLRVRVSHSTVRGWVFQGKLTAAPAKDAKGRQVYRFGTALDLWRAGRRAGEMMSA